MVAACVCGGGGWWLRGRSGSLELALAASRPCGHSFRVVPLFLCVPHPPPPLLPAPSAALADPPRASQSDGDTGHGPVGSGPAHTGFEPFRHRGAGGSPRTPQVPGVHPARHGRGLQPGVARGRGHRCGTHRGGGGEGWVRSFADAHEMLAVTVVFLCLTFESLLYAACGFLRLHDATRRSHPRACVLEPRSTHPPVVPHLLRRSPLHCTRLTSQAAVHHQVRGRPVDPVPHRAPQNRGPPGARGGRGPRGRVRHHRSCVHTRGGTYKNRVEM